jgi:hypothetical protein
MKYDTLKVVFINPIAEVNNMFEQDLQSWGVLTIKEWIENYESSRFTLIDGHTAIITSEYNMEHVEHWLLRNINLKYFTTIK